MIVDLNHAPPPDTPHDVVIVGGGTVALLLAVLLERQGQRVLVLETGGGSFEAPAQALNEASVTGRAHTGIAVARGRAIGGSGEMPAPSPPATPLPEPDFVTADKVSLAQDTPPPTSGAASSPA